MISNVIAMTDADYLLITAHDCHLCAHARTVLASIALPVREYDVTSDEATALAARGVPLTMLPVLVQRERVLAYGRFSERRLRRDLGL